ILKKSWFIAYLIDKYKTSSHCSACEGELEKFKTIPNSRPYQTHNNPNVTCHGFLK
ncbi:hypothetical protein BD408DRAFT_335857, partial [Parasitella parasitica]